MQILITIKFSNIPMSRPTLHTFMSEYDQLSATILYITNSVSNTYRLTHVKCHLMKDFVFS
jgi:hypothetical protein